MLIQCGYDIEFELPAPVVMTTLLQVHPTGQQHLKAPDKMIVQGGRVVDEFADPFGNLETRLVAEAGTLRLSARTVVEVSGDNDVVPWQVTQAQVEDLPAETLPYLLSSRYCEVDLISPIAWDLFGNYGLGWERVAAVLNWVHDKVEFGYRFARPTKTALDVLHERSGVCRDFQHLAISFCRALNIPARYVSGYLGDIGVPKSESPMDFSAWFEVYLNGRWWTADARHNRPRIGRVLMTTGRDAVDVAITTAYGSAPLKSFFVITDEIKPA